MFKKKNILILGYGKIGGHCIIPNAELIKDYFKSEIVDYVLKLK